MIATNFVAKLSRAITLKTKINNNTLNIKTQKTIFASYIFKIRFWNVLLSNALFFVCFQLAATNPTIDSLLTQLQQLDSNSNTLTWINTAENIGIAYQKNFDYNNAIFYYNKSLHNARRVGQVARSHQIVVRIAEILYRQSKYDIALRYVKEIENEIDQSDLPLKAQVFRFIGINKVYTGDYSNAYRYQNQALSLFQTLKDTVNMCRLHFGIGTNFYFQKQYETALYHYKESLRISEEANNLQTKYGAYDAIGNLYSQINDTAKSLKYNYLALEIAYQLKDKSGIGWTMHTIGNIEGKTLGLEQKAIERLKQVAQIGQELGDVGLGTAAKITSASIYLRLKQPDIALELLRKSLVDAQNDNMRSFMLDIFRHTAESYYQKRDIDNFYKYHKKYIALKDSLFNDNLSKEMSGLKKNFEILQLEKENEFNLLKKDHEIQKVKTNFNIGILVAIFVIAALLLLIMYMRNKSEKEKNLLLEIKHKEITRQNEILAVSNRDLEQYAYIISHDLKEPLRNISSFTNLLDRKLKNVITPDTQQYIDYILKGTKQMHDLLHDLLLYSKISRHKKEIENIRTDILVKEVLAILSEEIESLNAQIVLESLPNLLFDKQQLKTIFTHLIKNALKFRRDEPPKIIIKNMQDIDNHIISIEDNGIGIDERYFEKIFIIFQRIHDRGKYVGTSMGLATCKKILEENGGKIWVTSKLEEGSTFYIAIPKVL